jgi:hypothetical protein
MQYVCEFLFGGSVYKLSRVLNLNYGHLWKVLFANSRVTVNMLAHVVSCTNVRAEWLLCGVGPMFLKQANPEEAEFKLADSVNSSFTVFDSLSVKNDAKGWVVKKPDSVSLDRPTVLPPEAVTAARAIHQARVAGKPVSVFLGSDAAQAGCLEFVKEFVAKDYVTHVGLTGSVVSYDLGPPTKPPLFDPNYVARLAALQGLGYGEALGKWACDNKLAPDSLLHGMLNLKRPVTVHVEIGELAEHLLPAIHGAECGASLGAATYVDLLIFAEQ